MRIKKGMTLIELLLVISIIGALCSIMIVAIKPVRSKARDARRVEEINGFYKGLEVCYSESGAYPNSSSIWDGAGSGWSYSFSCGSCYGNFKYVIKQCVAVEVKDPINLSPLAYYYFYFEPTATTYNGVPINDICKGRFALMAHLENPVFENSGCFNEPSYYEYWQILGL